MKRQQKHRKTRTELAAERLVDMERQRRIGMAEGYEAAKKKFDEDLKAQQKSASIEMAKALAGMVQSVSGMISVFSEECFRA